MRSRRGSVFVGAVLVWLMCVGSAWATASVPYPVIWGTGQWLWSGTGLYTEFSAQTFGTGNSFSLVNSSNQSVVLLGSAAFVSQMNVTGDATSGYTANITYNFGMSGTAASLNLGQNAEFSFIFSDGTSDSTIYNVVQTLDTNYTLTYDGGIAVNFTAPSSTGLSSVPIPGSVLLLGSSVLGLLGIASRKNRA